MSTVTRESVILARGVALRRLTEGAEAGRVSRAEQVEVLEAAERPTVWTGFGGDVSGALLHATVTASATSTLPDGSPVGSYATRIVIRDRDSSVVETGCDCEDHRYHVDEGSAAHVRRDQPGGFGSYVWACKHVLAVASRYRDTRRAELRAADRPAYMLVP